MALVSPGQEITVTDESQYVPGAVGTVPFILLATAQNKIYNNAVAPGTQKANAGTIIGVTSQRDLVSNFGTPTFQLSSAGTPLHGNELNEYGLMAAYSALGLGNNALIIRADVDLAALTATSVRPVGDAADGTYWLDTSSNSTWGIYEWDAVAETFSNKVPLMISSASQLITGSTTALDWQGTGFVTVNAQFPASSVGQIGQYAINVSSLNNYVFRKAVDNNWYLVGSTDWQLSLPVVVGTNSLATGGNTFTPSDTVTINGVTVTITGGTDINAFVASINAANISGVLAANLNGKVALYVSDKAKSTGIAYDGTLIIAQTTNAFTLAGISIGTYYAPKTQFSGFAQVPAWQIQDPQPRPTGSVWFKTSVQGNGANIVINKFSEATRSWTAQSAQLFNDLPGALYGLDPFGGGAGIAAGTVYIRYTPPNVPELASFQAYVFATSGTAKASGFAITSLTPFTPGDQFLIEYSVIGTATTQTVTVQLSGNTPAGFVSDVLAKSIPNVTASFDGSKITFTHSAGGYIRLQNVTGTPLAAAMIQPASGPLPTGIQLASKGGVYIANVTPLTYTYSTTAPYTAPATGTLWYFGDPTQVDIMINDGAAWRGYKNVTRDPRGYNLTNTDPNGAIVAALPPVTQSDGTALVPGDLWINSESLDSFPVISRWTATNQWQLIDNTDHVSQNGIVFADARWDNSGTTDPIVGALTPISTLLTSDYVDLDCPSYALYPRGALLFNLRRSGYNVKEFNANYFNAQAYPNQTLPAEAGTWVTVSGLQNDGSPFMGRKAQRAMVVKALKAAVDGSSQIREDGFQFNLLCCPGYPELIPNLVALNNDRKNTGFIIGDTPMNLQPTITALTAWRDDTNGDGLATADPYTAVFYPSGLTNDLAGNTIAVPPSHMMLRTFIRSDNVSYMWFAPAGTRRGLIDNANGIGYVDTASGSFIQNGINQGLRDAMYPMAINPITLLPGIGLLAFGQKTLNPVASSMDRINVARLVNYLRTIFAHVGNGFLFEPNDKITRDQIKQLIEGALVDLVAKRGLYDFLVVCDDSNNTPTRIAANELYVDIAVEPMKAVEFIYIPIRLMNPGAITTGA